MLAGHVTALEDISHPNGVIAVLRYVQDEMKDELAAEKCFLQGPDKHGRGVIILKTSRHSKTKRNLEETKRLICYTLDHQIKLHDLSRNPDAKGVGIFDLQGRSLCPAYA